MDVNKLKAELLNIIAAHNETLSDVVTIDGLDEDLIYIFDTYKNISIYTGKDVERAYKTLQYNNSLWKTKVNETDKPEIVKVYLIHDNHFLRKSNAEVFEDGKDTVSTYHIVLAKGESITEGEQCYYYLYNDWDQANEYLSDHE